MTWEPLDWSLRKRKKGDGSSGSQKCRFWKRLAGFEYRRETFRVPVCRSSPSPRAQKGQP